MLTICNGSVVCRLVEAVRCKRVRDSSMFRLDKTVINGIVKTLSSNKQMYPSIVRRRCRQFPLRSPLCSKNRIERTDPVKTFADFVDQVPTSWALRAETEEARHAPAMSSDCSETEDIVGGERVW